MGVRWAEMGVRWGTNCVRFLLDGLRWGTNVTMLWSLVSAASHGARLGGLGSARLSSLGFGGLDLLGKVQSAKPPPKRWTPKLRLECLGTWSPGHPCPWAKPGGVKTTGQGLVVALLQLVNCPSHASYSCTVYERTGSFRSQLIPSTTTIDVYTSQFVWATPFKRL